MGGAAFTPVISKVIVSGKNAVSLIVPFPVRFGNGQPASLGTAVLFTVSI